MSTGNIPASFYRNLVVLLAGAIASIHQINQMLSNEPIEIRGMILFLIFIVVFWAGYHYIDSVEKESGVSIIHRPMVGLRISDCDSETTRATIYDVAFNLSSGYKISYKEKQYIIHTSLSDFFPEGILLNLGYFEINERHMEAKPISDVTCWINLKTNILVMWTGYFGKWRKELLDLLEESLKKEIIAKKGNIKTIFSRRPK